MRIQKIQPAISKKMKSNLVSKKQKATEALSKVVLKNKTATVALASISAAAIGKNNKACNDISCFSIWGDNLPMGFSC